MKTSLSIALDTNILIHAYDQNSPFYSPAKKLILEASHRKLNASIAPQNAFEMYSAITKKRIGKKTSSQDLIIETMLDYLFSGIFTVVIPNEKTLFTFAKIIETTPPKPGPHIYDLFLAATLLSHGITTLYTQNTRDFAGIKGIKAVNPFK